jgi:hypothetical protein
MRINAAHAIQPEINPRMRCDVLPLQDVVGRRLSSPARPPQGGYHFSVIRPRFWTEVYRW